MSKAKKGVIDVKFTLIGRVYGAHVVVIYWELNLEEQN
jgi:hypothetical protein